MQNKTYPYTLDQLIFFRDEIRKAGGVDELMFQKEALQEYNGMIEIITNVDIEAYKEKHLVGIYESLRNNFTTEVPYVFWSKLYSLLQRCGISI